MQDDVLTFTEHVGQLLKTIFAAIGVFILAASLVHTFREPVIQFLFQPLGPSPTSLQFLSPLDPLLFILKVDFVFGFFLATPIIIWLGWRYVQPATHVRSWLVLLLLLISTALTCIAVTYSYAIVVPIVLEFMNIFIIEGTTAAYTAHGYLNFFLSTSLLLMLVFQIPLLILALTGLHIVNPADIKERRPHIYVGILIVSAVITPTTDIITLALITIPAIVLTEIGIQVATLLHRRE